MDVDAAAAVNASGEEVPQAVNSPRYASAAAAAVTSVGPEGESRSNDAAFPQFTLLPRELQIRILTFACRNPQTWPHSSRLESDQDTTLALLCVSQRIQDLVIPIHFSHIRIDRPSTLRSVYEAIVAHPERGNMINSLHLGPKDSLSSTHWPFELEEQHGEEGELNMVLLMKTGLQQMINSYFSPTRYDDEVLAPRWHDPGMLVCADRPLPGCRAIAAFDAFITIAWNLDVNPYRREWSNTGAKVGLAAWSRRIFELRAALDIYLIEMRRIEDERRYEVPDWRKYPAEGAAASCLQGTCSHVYPRLMFLPRLSGNYVVSPAPGATVYLITTLQISRQLAKAQQYPMTDRFDHPLVFARSGWPSVDEDIEEEGQQRIESLLSGPHHDEDLELGLGLGRRSGSLLPSEAEVQKAQVVHQGAGYEETTDAAAYLRELALPNTATEELLPSIETLGGLFTMARLLIALAPNLVNLPLTGIFHRILSSRTASPLDQLKFLSIGPVLPYWTALFKSPAAARMGKLEKLRICSTKLTDEEADLIAGVAGVMPRLREVVWECVGLDDDHADLRVHVGAKAAEVEDKAG